MKKVIIGSRGSELALAQTEEVRSALKALHPDFGFSVRIIKTEGDRLKDEPLTRLGGKGIFTKEIEQALIDGKIDLAVHSMKDLPTDLPEEIALAAITKREDPHDCLIAKDKGRLSRLRRGARIGTGSLRRKAQLLNYRSDLEIVDIRGNITTRIDKLFGKRGDFKYKTPPLDAIVLSACGLDRLSLKDLDIDIISFELMLPAAGQGALGVETRKGDVKTIELTKPLNELNSRLAVIAERSLLEGLGGGCQIPLGCVGMVEDKKLKLEARILSNDGTKKIEGKVEGDKEEAVELGKALALLLRKKGCEDLLK